MKKENQKKVTEDKKNSKKDMYILHYENTVYFTEQYKKIFQGRFCKLLEEFIKQGHQQKEITEKTGISAASITQYKNGINTPKGYTLESLANFFNVSSNYLLGKSSTPTYTFEDINNKTGLSQKAIENLYKLQHDISVFDEEIKIDFTEERKVSKSYKKQIDILNLILENNINLFGLLENIRKYKDLYENLGEIKKKYSEKVNKDIVMEIFSKENELKHCKYDVLEQMAYIIEQIVKEEENKN